MPDAPMADAAPAAAEETKEEKKEKEPSTFVVLKTNVALVEKSVSTRDNRFIMRVWRTLSSTRKKLTANALSEVINTCFPPSNPVKDSLLGWLEPLKEVEPMEVDEAAPAAAPEKKPKEKKAPTSLLPETEVYLHVLVINFLVDKKKVEEALACVGVAMERLKGWNRRTLDPISAKMYFCIAWVYELSGKFADIRSWLLAAHRTACLHHNSIGQAVLLNCLLRNYLYFNLYEQADKLVAKTTFPESASNNQLARYLFYIGRIKAVQLEYSEAHRCLQQAIRKAPQQSALGFRLTVHKLSSIVQLLMGEIPDRSTFRMPQMRKPLFPYLKIVQAVRMGDLAAFRSAMETHSAAFHADKTHTLIVRLRQNVIRAGLRNINLSYSSISLEDVCKKLCLDHPEDIESIVAKAIRDGVIDALIDHGKGILQSKEHVDIYSTLEPQAAFHKRITFCLNVHNEAVKAMTYPPDAHKGDFEDADKRKERQREEQELAQSLAEEEEDEF